MSKVTIVHCDHIIAAQLFEQQKRHKQQQPDYSSKGAKQASIYSQTKKRARFYHKLFDLNKSGRFGKIVLLCAIPHHDGVATRRTTQHDSP